METKTCSICKKDLPLDSEHFASRKGVKKVRYQGICRDCQKEYRKKHYEANKEKYIRKAKVYTKSVVEWFQDIKRELKCEQCGDQRWWVLDFHHKNPEEKDSEVSSLIRKGNKSKILEEISKCKVLCANCHRDLHYQENAA